MNCLNVREHENRCKLEEIERTASGMEPDPHALIFLQKWHKRDREGCGAVIEGCSHICLPDLSHFITSYSYSCAVIHCNFH